ncbi:hypothetical protein D3C84_981660 [compost metagenome]
MPLYITGVRPACKPSKSVSLTLTLIPAAAASKSSYRRNGRLGSVGGLSLRFSGVANAIPPATILAKDSLRTFTPDRLASMLMPLAFQKRVCLRTSLA